MTKRDSSPDLSTTMRDVHGLQTGHGNTQHNHYYGQATLRWSWPRAWDFSGYVGEKRAGFVGRGWLFDKLQAWLQDPSGAQAMLVLADYGVGKSALMAELSTGARSMPIVAHHFCHSDVMSTLDPATFVVGLASQLADAFPRYRAVVENTPDLTRYLDQATRDPSAAFDQAVVAPLHSLPVPDQPVVLLVDALDEALDLRTSSDVSAPLTIVRLLSRQTIRLPFWLRVLATSRHRDEVTRPLAMNYRTDHIDAEGSENLDDLHAYARARFETGALARRAAAAAMSPSQIADRVAHPENSGGKFLYVVHVLNDVERGTRSLHDMSALPRGMNAFYFDLFERRFADAARYRQQVAPILALLCAQQEPMRRDELAAVLQVETRAVADALQGIYDLLRTGNQTLAFEHVSLSQWLGETDIRTGNAVAGRFGVDKPRAEDQLRKWAVREVEGHRAHASPYLARHLFTHLSATEAERLVPGLLIEFDWLRERLRAVGCLKLLNDFIRSESEPELKAVERSLRQSAHVLSRNDASLAGVDQLASQLLGHLREHNEPPIRKLCESATAHLQGLRAPLPLTASLKSSEALIATLTGHRGSVDALSVLSDGRLASGSGDGMIKLWDVQGGECEATLQGHDDGVLALVALADGRLASSSRDGTIKIWNVYAGICETTFRDHTTSGLSLALLPDCRLVSGSSDGTIKLWDLHARACVATLHGHSKGVGALVVTPPGGIASRAFDDEVRLWTAPSPTNELLFHHPADVSSTLAVLHDGRLVSASLDVIVWDPLGASRDATLEGHTDDVWSLIVLSDNRVVSGASDDTIRVWNTENGDCDAVLQAHTGTVTALVELSDGRLVSGSADKTIKLWDLHSRAAAAAPKGGYTNRDLLLALPDGRLAARSHTGQVELWDPVRGTCDAIVQTGTRGIGALAALQDGRMACAYTEISLWDPRTGDRVGTLPGHDYVVSAMTSSTDGRLASACFDINLWDSHTKRRLAVLEGHSVAVRALAFLPDGRLASASGDGTIKLWNVSTEACTAILEDHASGVAALQVLPDGRLLSGSRDGTIRLWNLRSCTSEVFLAPWDRWPIIEALPDGRIAHAADPPEAVRLGTPGQSRVVFVAPSPVRALCFLQSVGVLAVADSASRLHFLRM